MEILQEEEQLLSQELELVCKGSRYLRCTGLIQHGNTSDAAAAAGKFDVPFLTNPRKSR